MANSRLKNVGLYNDYYELSMAQGYFFAGKKDEKTVFDYFFRTNPFQGGFLVFAGLTDLLDALREFKYDDEELTYLSKNGFMSNDSCKQEKEVKSFHRFTFIDKQIIKC